MTPDEIILAIEKLSAEDRQRVYEAQRKHPVLSEEYSFMSNESLARMNQLRQMVCNNMSELLQDLFPYKTGPQAKKQRKEQRHALIDQAMAQGITRATAILEFVKSINPDLVRKGKNGTINARIMLRTYNQERKQSA